MRTTTTHTNTRASVGHYDAEFVGYKVRVASWPFDLNLAVVCGRDKAHALANAKHFVTCWNSHDALLAVSAALVAWFDGERSVECRDTPAGMHKKWLIEEATWFRLVEVIRSARAAIAKAKRPNQPET